MKGLENTRRQPLHLSNYDFKNNRVKCREEGTCPITLGKPKNPVTLTQNTFTNVGGNKVTRRVYNKDALIRWIREGGTHPLTRESVKLENIVPVSILGNYSNVNKNILVNHVAKRMQQYETFSNRYGDMVGPAGLRRTFGELRKMDVVESLVSHYTFNEMLNKFPNRLSKNLNVNEVNMLNNTNKYHKKIYKEFLRQMTLDEKKAFLNKLKLDVLKEIILRFKYSLLYTNNHKYIALSKNLKHKPKADQILRQLYDINMDRRERKLKTRDAPGRLERGTHNSIEIFKSKAKELQKQKNENNQKYTMLKKVYPNITKNDFITFKNVLQQAGFKGSDFKYVMKVMEKRKTQNKNLPQNHIEYLQSARYVKNV